MLFLAEYAGFILEGLALSIEVTAVGVLGGLALGTLAAIGDLYGGRVIRLLVNCYVEFFRGSPLIAQLFLFYFTIPSLLDIPMDALTAGYLTFILNSGAYQKGYLKGAMEAVFKDQMLAAMSIGLTKWQALRYVVVPQALRIVIPAWSNELCSLAKSTSALIVIGVRELMSTGYSIASQTFRPLETYAFIALLYFLWIYCMLKILDVVYERVKIPGLEPTVA